MWEESLAGIKKHLITYSSPSNFTVLAERPNGLEGNLHPKMDHLVCFLPGTIALSTTGGVSVEQAKKLLKWDAQKEENLELAKELMKTCWACTKSPKLNSRQKSPISMFMAIPCTKMELANLRHHSTPARMRIGGKISISIQLIRTTSFDLKRLKASSTCGE